MNHWLVKMDGPTVTHDDMFDIRIKSRTRVNIRIGDRVIAFQPFGKELQFTRTAKVLDVSSEQIAKDDTYVTRIRAGETTTLEEETTLTAFMYSLTFVRNLPKPYLHFRRTYRTIPAEDFETLVRGEPFIARTAYYELLLALPESLRASFDIEGISNTAYQVQRNTYASQLARLRNFISDRVLAVGAVIEDLSIAAARVQAAASADGEMLHLLLDEDSNETRQPWGMDNISVQAALFVDLRQSLQFGGEDAEGHDLIGQTLSLVEEPDRRNLEQRFERIFRLTR